MVIVRPANEESVFQEEGPTCTKTERCEHVHTAGGVLTGLMLGDEAGSLIQGLPQPVYKFGFCSLNNRVYYQE